MLDNVATYIWGALCLAFILSVNLYQIILHLKNYTEPLYQRYILRIIFIVSVSGITSFCTVVLPEEGIWFDTVRQWYEAWVIYNFTCLLLAYVGGPGQVEVKLEGKQLRRSCLLCTCCVAPRHLVVNGRYVKLCKQMTLQFVYVITTLSIITVILFEKGLYIEGDWSPDSSYLWITILYNISYTLALSALFFFYYGTHELLEPFKPILKFLVIKGVVFLTFWQGILCSILYTTGILATPEDAKVLQNFLTLTEMVVAAVMMGYAFPWKEYMVTSSRDRSSGLRIGDIRDAVSIHDVVSDTYHSFAPAYHDYVLYSDGPAKTPKAGDRAKKGNSARQVRKSFRARTFLMMGQESATTSMGQQMGLVKDMEMGVWKADGSPADARPPGEEAGGSAEADVNEDPFAMDGISEEDVDLSVDHEVSLGHSEDGKATLPDTAGGSSSNDILNIMDSEGDGGQSDRSGGSGGPSALSKAAGKQPKQWVHIDLGEKAE